jgi:hypothetical protein
MSEPDSNQSRAGEGAAGMSVLLKAFAEHGRAEDLRDALMRALFGGALHAAPGYEEVWRTLRRQLLALHTITNSGRGSSKDRFSRDEARTILATLFKNELQVDGLKAIVNEAILAGMANKALGSQEKRASHLATKILPALYENIGVADEHLNDEAIIKRWRRMKQDAKANAQLEDRSAGELRRLLRPRKYGTKKIPKPSKP